MVLRDLELTSHATREHGTQQVSVVKVGTLSIIYSRTGYLQMLGQIRSFRTLKKQSQTRLIRDFLF